MDTKVCTGCNVEKPLDAFYRRANAQHLVLSECKDCMKARGKKHSKIDRRVSTVASEQHAIAMLNGAGIPSLPGKALSHTFADVICWGCVLIEVKYAKQSEDRMFSWSFSPTQVKQGLRGDLIMLVCEWRDGYISQHVFDARDSVFYREDNRLKSAITYKPNRSNAGKQAVFTERLMKDHQNAWSLIAQKRIAIENELREGKLWLVNERLKAA